MNSLFSGVIGSRLGIVNGGGPAKYDFKKSKRVYYNQKLNLEKNTIRLKEEVVEYFKKIVIEKRIPYQALINLYQRNCKDEEIEINVDWKKRAKNLNINGRYYDRTQ